MPAYSYRDRTLYCEGVALAEIAARAGTPCYVYSAATVLENFHAYDDAFGDQSHTVCFSVKANGNLSVLRLLAGAGAGFDIVSGGELYRVLKAGGDASKIVFSGVGKTATEIDEALAAGIFAFNCESQPELALLDALAHRRGVKARVALRVNPDVETDKSRTLGQLARLSGTRWLQSVYMTRQLVPNDARAGDLTAMRSFVAPFVYRLWRSKPVSACASPIGAPDDHGR